MYPSTLRLVAAMVMTLAVAACGDRNGPLPTATAPTPTSGSAINFALFGVVSEMTANGIVPVEGVMMQVCPATRVPAADARSIRG